MSTENVTEQQPLILTDVLAKKYDINVSQVKKLLENPVFQTYQGIFQVKRIIHSMVKVGKAAPELDDILVEKLGMFAYSALIDVLKEKGWKQSEIGAAHMIANGGLVLPQNH